MEYASLNESAQNFQASGRGRNALMKTFRVDMECGVVVGSFPQATELNKPEHQRCNRQDSTLTSKEKSTRLLPAPGILH